MLNGLGPLLLTGRALLTAEQARLKIAEANGDGLPRVARAEKADLELQEARHNGAACWRSMHGNLDLR